MIVTTSFLWNLSSSAPESLRKNWELDNLYGGWNSRSQSPQRTSAWLQKYTIDYTQMQKEAKAELEKYLHKHLNNSLFRKTVENQRDRINLDFLSQYNTANLSYHLIEYRNSTQSLDCLFLRIFSFKNKPAHVSHSVNELTKLQCMSFTTICSNHSVVPLSGCTILVQFHLSSA